jgi:hypothetical protein
MKAIYNGSTPITWAVSGAPDNTGIYSGYPTNTLTSISVDYSVNPTLAYGGSVPVTPGAGYISTRYTSIDGYTSVIYALNETSAPYINGGSGSVMNLTASTGTPQSVNGLFGSAVSFSSTILTSGNTSLNQLNYPITLSVWVNLRSYTTNGTIFAKEYRNDNTYTSPFASIFINLSGSNDGTYSLGITTSGTNQSVSVSGINILKLNTWNLISLTYDGTTLRTYLNGNSTGTLAVSGNIDYGTSGAFDVGGVVASGNVRQIDGIIEDIRFENVVRNQAYILQMYKAGLGLFDTYAGNIGSVVLLSTTYLPILNSTFTTSQAVYSRAATFYFNKASVNSTTPTFKFTVIADATNNTNPVSIRLYDITNNNIITTLSTSSTTAIYLQSGALTLASGNVMYEVQIAIQTVISGQTGSISMARLEIT